MVFHAVAELADVGHTQREVRLQHEVEATFDHRHVPRERHAGHGEGGRLRGECERRGVRHVTEGMDIVKKILEAPTSPDKGIAVMKAQMLDPEIKIVKAARVK